MPDRTIAMQRAVTARFQHHRHRPGPEPGTSALTLKVKDQLPLHARTELNNDSTPGTPELRENTTVQYDNLWNLNHQVGLQYSFTPDQFKENNYFNETPLDDPLIANYSGYYRLPTHRHQFCGTAVASIHPVLNLQRSDTTPVQRLCRLQRQRQPELNFSHSSFDF